jgi:hypothetical protein
MTNKVESIVASITAKLKTAGISTVIRFPEDIHNIGNRYPLAIIREERQEFEIAQGQRYEYWLTISITLVSDQTRSRMYYMNNLQVAVFAQLFTDERLGDLVVQIEPVTVDMGNLLSGSNLSGYAGFTETNSFREITLKCLVRDTRP